MFIGHAEEVYEGMIVGINSRDNDLVVNPLKGKQLTNVRASGTDEAVVLTTPINVTLEYALEFINDDELNLINHNEFPFMPFDEHEEDEDVEQDPDAAPEDDDDHRSPFRLA